jgi:hypothetical protein
MPQVLPTGRVNRWYQLRRPLSDEVCHFFAERYFDSGQEAFAYWEQRQSELGPDRVHRPVLSHENPRVWAVCIDPQ